MFRGHPTARQDIPVPRIRIRTSQAASAGIAWGVWSQVDESVLRYGPEGEWRPELTPGPPHWPLPSVLKSVFLAATLLFLLVIAERIFAAVRQWR